MSLAYEPYYYAGRCAYGIVYGRPQGPLPRFLVGALRPSNLKENTDTFLAFQHISVVEMKWVPTPGPSYAIPGLLLVRYPESVILPTLIGEFIRVKIGSATNTVSASGQHLCA